MIPILMVGDDKNLNHVVCFYLGSSNFEAAGCLSAKEICEEMYHRRYELIISDIMMSGTGKSESVKSVRGVNETTSVLFISVRDDLPSRQRGFQLGVDDYMAKPIELDELLLRVRAPLRQANIEMERHITVGNLELNMDAMAVFIDGEEIPTTTREFHILHELLSYPDKTFPRAQLMGRFWGVDTDSSLRAADVHITKLRNKFSQYSGFKIRTIRGIKYKAMLR